METTTTDDSKPVRRHGRQVSLWVPPELLDQCTAIAEAEYLTRNAYIVRLIAADVRANEAAARAAERQSA